MAAILISSFTADSFHFLTPFSISPSSLSTQCSDLTLMPASFVLLPPSPLPPKIPSIASPSPEPVDGLPWPSAHRPDWRSRGAEPRNQELELEEASSGGSTTSTTHVSTEVFSPTRGCQEVAMTVISLFFPPNSFHFFCAFLCLVGIGLEQCLLWCRLCSEATLGQCLGDDWFFLPIQCCCCSAVLSRLVGLDSFLGLWWERLEIRSNLF